MTSLTDLRRARQALSGSLGLVPTRPALHAGPLSLVSLARRENDHVAVAVFATGDSAAALAGQADDAAGRTRTSDMALLEALGVDLVWIPSGDQTGQPAPQTSVNVELVTAPLEGKHRPAHFRGVATRVARLFNAFTPRRAYFGQKDAQQVVVVRRLVLDMNFDVEVVVGPVAREPDGLAASRANELLSAAERPAATLLHRALTAALAAYSAGERDGDALRSILSSALAGEPLAREEYVSVADRDTLDELDHLERGALLSLAARVGKTRLTDSLVLE